MNTYSLYRNDELIASKASRKDIRQYTGISESMFCKCVDERTTYKKTYRIEIDGEVVDSWAERFTHEWNRVRFKLNPKLL